MLQRCQAPAHLHQAHTAPPAWRMLVLEPLTTPWLLVHQFTREQVMAIQRPTSIPAPNTCLRVPERGPSEARGDHTHRAGQPAAWSCRCALDSGGRTRHTSCYRGPSAVRPAFSAS